MCNEPADTAGNTKKSFASAATANTNVSKTTASSTTRTTDKKPSTNTHGDNSLTVINTKMPVLDQMHQSLVNLIKQTHPLELRAEDCEDLVCIHCGYISQRVLY